MKSGPGSAALAKRRRGPGVAVLALVLFSFFFLTFLFGRPPNVYVVEEVQQDNEIRSFGRLYANKQDELDRQDIIIKNTKIPPPDLQKEAGNATQSGIPWSLQYNKSFELNNDIAGNHKVHTETGVVQPISPINRTTNSGDEIKKKQFKGSNSDEAARACQLEFGSYCFWSIEHKEVMNDSIVKRLKDQLFVARSYYPSIAKIKGKEKLTQDMKINIQDHEKILSESSIDDDLPSYIGKKIKTMEQVISKAKSCTVDCNNVDRKLSQILDMTEDEAHFHMKQSAFLYNLGVLTMPKSHHCLSMRLMVEYFKAPVDSNNSYGLKFNSPDHRHYVIFSRNILAASVVINSTFSSSQVRNNMVFHVLTDAENYYAMKNWFARNHQKNEAVGVINYEEFVTKIFPSIYLRQFFLPEEFRISIHSIKRPTDKTRMEYLSIFSHSHFLLPEIFKDLKKVIVLDDDMVVQRDLSFLWNLNLGDKVNGAVRSCSLRFGQLHRYLGRSTYDPESCAWMSGLNIIDLEKWRQHKVTEKYKQLLEQFKSEDEASTRVAALPISLLAFENLIYPLDKQLVVSRLGYDYDIDEDVASGAVALHYNGNMKPWFELGIPKYKDFWRRFLTHEERFMDDCNVHL